MPTSGSQAPPFLTLASSTAMPCHGQTVYGHWSGSPAQFTIDRMARAVPTTSGCRCICCASGPGQAGVRGPSLLSATVQLTLGPFFSSRSSGERRYACRDEQSRLARHELSLPALQPPGRFPGRHPRHPSVAATELYNRTRSTSVAVDRGEQPRCSMGSNIQRLVDQRIQLSPSTDRSPESRRVQRT